MPVDTSFKVTSPISPIEIALAADQKFFNGLLVTAGSIAIFATPESHLSFHILDGGLNDPDFEFLQRRVSEIHPNSVLSRHKVTTGLFQDLKEWRGAGRMTYVRLLLGNILQDTNHVIYCDTDFIWLRDIATLWEMRDDKTLFISIRDGIEETESIEAKWFAANGFDFSPEKYFCAGLSFFNLTAFRHENLFEKALKLLKTCPEIYAADQTALNAVLSSETNRVKIIDQNWARNTFYLTPEMMADHPVLHFAGLTPWKNLFQARILTNQTLLWFWIFSKLTRQSCWTALRTYYSPMRIISSRLIFLAVSRSRTMQQVLRIAMSAMGKPKSAYEYISPFMRNVKIPSDLLAQIKQRTL